MVLSTNRGKCLLEEEQYQTLIRNMVLMVTQVITVTVSKTEFETTYNFTPEVGDIITDQENIMK
jgi:hypothetical protein